MLTYILGFDIGGTKCAVNLARLDNGIELLDKESFPTKKGFIPTKDCLISTAHNLLVRNNVSADALAAIGVSCGGPLNSKLGVIISPPHLPGWDNIPIVEILSQEFNVPVYLHNDANACALVEWKLGAGRGTRDMIFITMGTGFGAGIIAEGRLIEGATGLGGEIGHVRLESDGPVVWGKAGSVEAFCSGEGMALSYKDGNYTTKEIAKEAEAGEPEALQFFHETGRLLGKALAIVVDILNPEFIIIGSIFVRCEQWLRRGMEEALREEALPESVAACRVLPAETGELIGDYASILAACYSMGITVTT